jgi:hypothetical protein
VVDANQQFTGHIRIYAPHRPEHLAALRELLDVFIDAGWPQAHRLVYSLDEIFR